LGFDISLRTVEKTDWAKIRHIFNYIPTLKDESFLVDRLPVPRTYRSLLSIFCKTKGPGSIIFNTNGDAIPTILDDFSYVHIPLPLSLSVRDEALDNVGPFWDMYFGPNRLLRRSLDKLDSSSVLLTNSEFSKSKIREFWDRNAEVLYPPVDVETYQNLIERNPEREDWVVTISRFDSVKNLGIIPWIASHCKSAKKFIVIGSVRPGDMSIINQLKTNALKLGVEEKIQIMPNASNEEKHIALSRAKVLFHPKLHEHFGISVVEGMASGCIPVVFNGGGPVEFVESCNRANRLEDFAPLIEDALRAWNPQKARELSRKADVFSQRNYQNRLSGILFKNVSASK
jgi:glycosyltransferase involved in cell wall biosynthesis